MCWGTWWLISKNRVRCNNDKSEKKINQAWYVSSSSSKTIPINETSNRYTSGGFCVFACSWVSKDNRVRRDSEPDERKVRGYDFDYQTSNMLCQYHHEGDAREWRAKRVGCDTSKVRCRGIKLWIFRYICWGCSRRCRDIDVTVFGVSTWTNRDVSGDCILHHPVVPTVSLLHILFSTSSGVYI